LPRKIKLYEHCLSAFIACSERDIGNEDIV